MITSYFVPKSKSKKRQRNDIDVANPVSGSKTQNPAAPITEESAALLSFLHRHGDDAGSPTDEVTTTWRKALGKHFATQKITELAQFVTRERCVPYVF